MTQEFNPEYDQENTEDKTVVNSVVPEAPRYDDSTFARLTSPDRHSAPTTPREQRVQISSEQSVTTPKPHGYSATAPPPSLYRESAARERVRKRRVNGRNSGEEWAWVIVAVALFGIVVMVSMSVFFLLRNTSSEQEIIPTAVANLSVLPTPANFRNDQTGSVGEELILEDGSSIILEPWDGQSRFTILVVGLDRRPGETGLAYRTDTMMLVSIDPETQSLGILSIPRDLYVDVPGYSQLQRINTPMLLGEIQQSGYGPRLAMETVQYNLGIRVNDFLAVDFQAFIDLVNAIGGITVTTDYTINDQYYPNMYYGYDPFYLPAGTHQLDGPTALKFARTRHGDNDFERANRQQEVIYAVRNRILDLDMLPGLIIQAPTLLASWEDNVYTNLNVEQIIRLAWYLKDVPSENIRTGVIDYNYTRPFTTNDGAAVLIPNRELLGSMLSDVFGANYSQ